MVEGYHVKEMAEKVQAIKEAATELAAPQELGTWWAILDSHPWWSGG